jgi:TIR domain
VRIEIYGNRASPEIGRFVTALGKQCTILGIPLDTAPAAAGLDADLSLVFADAATAWTPQQQQVLQRLVADAQLILPVIDTAPDAMHLPPALGAINAFKKSDTGRAWIDSLVDETLGMAWLKRRTRKVFVSYRRIDSSPVATQLFDRFSELDYEVFLDDASIPRGVDFQHELKWWLNDADLMLLLGSPRFPDSRWCMEEINFAQAHGIGIAALQWPAQIYGPNASVWFADKLGGPEPALLKATMEDQTLRLELGHFEGVDPDNPDPHPDLPSRRLTPEAMEKVLGLCARNRAKAIRSRLNELLPLVKDTLIRQGATGFTQTFGDVSYQDCAGKSCFVRVLPFRPGPEHIHQAYKDGGSVFLAACAYAESNLTDSRAEALRWLARKDHTTLQPAQCNSALWAFCGDIQV